jgi:hypothetical protein
MILLFTVPLWLGLIIFFVQMAARNSAPATIQRTLFQPPDGRQITITVPASEPLTTSIVRLFCPKDNDPEKWLTAYHKWLVAYHGAVSKGVDPA